MRNPELEYSVYEWIMEQRFAEIPVSTIDVIDKAVSLNPSFKNGDEKKRLYGVYDFLKRQKLSVRTRTRVIQIRGTAMQAVKESYCRSIMNTIRNRIGDPKRLINMDETNVYLNCTPMRTVHPKGERTVAVNIGGITPTRFTFTVTVAMDGSKLPLFVIFKGKRGDKIEKSFRKIVPAGITACVQAKGWMDNYTMGIWCNKIYRP